MMARYLQENDESLFFSCFQREGESPMEAVVKQVSCLKIRILADDYENIFLGVVPDLSIRKAFSHIGRMVNWQSGLESEFSRRVFIKNETLHATSCK